MNAREIARQILEQLKIPHTDFPANPFLTLEMLEGKPPRGTVGDTERNAFPLNTQLMVGGIARSNNGIRTTWGIDTPQSVGVRNTGN